MFIVHVRVEIYTNSYPHQAESLRRHSHFIFIWPCIVINFFLITNQMHQLFKFILLQNSTCCGHLLCPSTKSLLLYIRHW